MVFKNDSNLNHILHVDDILIFVEDNDKAITNLRCALNLFEKASGLSINKNKSTISPINVSISRCIVVKNELKINSENLPIMYLGIPLGGKPNSLSFWDNIILKIQKKLNGWKYFQLSKGGRYTLLQASLCSLPTYQLSVFKAPSMVYKKIEKIWRNFLWGSNSDNSKSSQSHLIY